MAKIHQLAPHVADLIAAGEVVERPGSVVKELLENSIDAGATHITVEIQNGGMTFIRLTDDGCGMEPEDAKIAFLRHATSKMQHAEDLASIQTLGFRGEALAAISSVSKIDLLTRTAAGAAGTSIHLDAGQITAFSEAGCPEGTTIIVRDLFYNTPARMKFMKSDAAEAANIFSAVQKQALSHPELSLRFIRDGQEILHTAGDGKLHSAIYGIWGRELANGMVPVESSWESITLSGFVTKPNVTRGNRNYQAFFVNGRYIKSKILSAALEDAYQNQMMVGRMPCCVLHLHLPFSMVDVNVHPAKTEIRFLSERAVCDCVRFGVMAALNRASGRVPMKLPNKNAAPVEPPAAPVQPKAKASARKEVFQSMTAEQYRQFSQVIQNQPRLRVDPELADKIERRQTVSVRDSTIGAQRYAKSAAQKPEAKPAQEDRPAPQEQPEQQSLLAGADEPYRVVGEVLDAYLIVEQAQCVLLIDKHAAHERILFERLKAHPEQIMGQRLLTPLTYTPDREEAALLLENRELLLQLGYEIEEFGMGALAIRQIPSEIAGSDAVGCLTELAEKLKNNRRTDQLRDEMYHTIACKAAIKAGWHTEPAERDALIAQVMRREDLKYCPHGRPICITLTKRQLEHQFKRT